MHRRANPLLAAAGAAAGWIASLANAVSWRIIFQIANRYAREISDAHLRYRDPRYFLECVFRKRHSGSVPCFRDGKSKLHMVDSLEQERHRAARQRRFSANRLR